LYEKKELHKACGPDNINSRVMKDLKDQVAPILTKIYTKSIETGTIPKDWKHANVAPAFKKGIIKSVCMFLLLLAYLILV
jgi:hypothetical protein